MNVVSLNESAGGATLAGVLVVAAAEAGTQIAEAFGQHPQILADGVDRVAARLGSWRPEVVVLGAVDGTLADILQQVSDLRAVTMSPLVVCVARGCGDWSGPLLDAGVTEVLVGTPSAEQLRMAASVAIARGRRWQALARDRDEARQALEDRKVIERAKGIFMRRLSLTEDDAYHRLRRIAMDRHVRLVEVARTVLEADEVMPHAESA